MKHQICILLALLLTLSTACHNNNESTRTKLERINNLIDQDPDSALILLSPFETIRFKMSEDDKMYYDLIKIKAVDKAYIGNSDIATINKLVDYYEETGNDKLLTLACYYAGSTFRDLYNYQLAVKYYLQALKLCEITKNKELYVPITFQLGLLMLKQNKPDNALYYLNLSEQAQKKDYKNEDKAYIYQKIAIAYDQKNIADSCMMYHDKAYNTALKTKDTLLANLVYMQKASFYLNHKDYQKADSIVSNTKIGANKSANEFRDVLKLSICMKTNRMEEARAVAQKLKSSKAIETRKRALSDLVTINAYLGDIKQRNIYYEQYSKLIDSIQSGHESAEMARLNAVFRYNQMLEEKSKEEALKAKTKNISIVLISLFAIAAVVSTLSLRNIHRKKKAISIRLKELETIIEPEKTSNNLTLFQQLRVYDSTLCNFIDNCIKNNKVLKQEEWDAIEAAIKELSPHFHSTIYSIMPTISRQNFQLCMLIKLGGIKNKDMAELMGRSPSCISKMRSAIKVRILGKESNIGLDNYFTDIIR